jgi:cell division protein FtsI (penicillin-binding protein 3)
VNRRINGRIRFLRVLIPLLLLLPAGKAFYLQVLDRDHLHKIAVKQNQITVNVKPRRGPIVDRNGQPLAISVPVPSVYADREKVEETGRTALLLSRVLDVDKSALKDRLNKGGGFVWLKRKVTPEEAERVRELDLPGVGIQEESRRYYPNMELAGSVLGFVGVDRGLEGLEYSLEDQLKGGRGVRILKRDAKGKAYAPVDFWSHEPTVGATVQLTLDRTIQYFTEQSLNAGCRAAGAKGGAAIVMETATGKILAMANYPGFNPNEFQKYSSERFRNRAVTQAYEPGSTFKVITVSAALEEKVFDEMDIFYCGNGKFQVADVVINDHIPHGWLTLKGIMQKSSNIGASKVGMELGRERMEQYSRDFGFGSRQKMLLPGEGRGILREASKWTQVDTANASFGQGLSVTPLQMANAVNALANGGRVMKPYLVESITTSTGGALLRNNPTEIRRVVSEETARKVIRMMESVTAPGGSGTKAAIPGYSVAGKTGTAQKFSVEERRYSEEAFVASFAGFAPARSAVVTAIVLVDEPEDEIYGGVVAAPIWREIVEKTLKYLEVERSLPAESVPEIPLPEGVKIARSGSEPNPARGFIMPDLRGMTLREALSVLSNLDCGVDVSGTGVVFRQSPEAGGGVGLKVQLGLMPRTG